MHVAADAASVNAEASPPRWTRRAWVTQQVAVVLLGGVFTRRARRTVKLQQGRGQHGHLDSLSSAAPVDRETLAQQAVEAARRAGAEYADARVTSVVQHTYAFGTNGLQEQEQVGIGVRALVRGAWGFAACPSAELNTAAQLGEQAAAQAAMNARGAARRPVELGPSPAVAVGRWTTPVGIDPFTISLEEKRAFMRYWATCAEKLRMNIVGPASYLRFVRQERVLVTSEGTRLTQTLVESGGDIVIEYQQFPGVQVNIRGIEPAGRGWEHILNADIPAQLAAMPEEFTALATLYSAARPATIGRYTLVCDGAAMAALLSATLGVATQLDRALGYEANATGTSFLDDPLSMLGSFQAAAAPVTVTANRSAPAQLATVKWDDEGIAPTPFPLINAGVLVDYQTTREQAAWLAPYYQKAGIPVCSHGCAAAESALNITLQHMPNLMLEPAREAVQMTDLIANVPDGLLVQGGTVRQIDAQARTGLFLPRQLRKVRNGRLGPLVSRGAVQFSALELWKHVQAVGGPETTMVVPFSQYPFGGAIGALIGQPVKGQPPQQTSHSVQAAAAVIANQPLIDPTRKV